MVDNTVRRGEGEADVSSLIGLRVVMLETWLSWLRCILVHAFAVELSCDWMLWRPSCFLEMSRFVMLMFFAGLPAACFCAAFCLIADVWQEALRPEDPEAFHDPCRLLGRRPFCTQLPGDPAGDSSTP